MARLPGYAESLPVPQPTLGVVNMPANPKNAQLVRSGEQIGRAGNELLDAFAAEQQQIAKTQAEDALNGLTLDEIDLTDGPNGYTHIRGGDAVSKPLLKDYTTELTRRYEERVKALSPEAQSLVRSRFEPMRARFMRGVLQYQDGENQSNHEAVFNSTLDLEAQQAGHNYRDYGAAAGADNGVERSLFRGYTAIDEYAQYKGLPKTWVNAQKKLFEAKAVENVMVSTLADDPYKAKNILSKPVEGLPDNKRMSLLRSAYTEINRHEAEAEKANTQLEVEGKKTIAMLALTHQLTHSDVVDFLDKDLISPDYAIKMQKMADNPGPDHDDMTAYLEYKLNPLGASPEEIATDERLTYKTRSQLIDWQRGMEEDAENWVSSQPGRDAIRLIREKFGILANGLIPDITGQNAQDAYDMQEKLYDKVEALPVEQRAQKSREIARELVKEYDDTQGYQSEMLNLHDQLDALPYHSVEEVNKAYEQTNKEHWIRGGMGEQQRKE